MLGVILTAKRYRQRSTIIATSASRPDAGQERRKPRVFAENSDG